MEKEIFSVQEFGQLIGFTPGTVRNWIQKGVSPVTFRKIGHGRRWVTTRAEINRWLKNQSERRNKAGREFAKEGEGGEGQ